MKDKIFSTKKRTKQPQGTESDCLFPILWRKEINVNFNFNFKLIILLKELFRIYKQKINIPMG